jgi:hypothetical protein
MISRWVAGPVLGLAFALSANPAFADVTAFIGSNTVPESRRVQGFALGAGVLIVGLEFEYSDTPDAPEAGAPSLRTGGGNLLLQTPFPIVGLQPYATAGAGVYRERLGSHAQTGFALNTGAGVKVTLVGPLRMRVDYRMFRLGSDALHSPAHRVYAGLNLAF